MDNTDEEALMGTYWQHWWAQIGSTGGNRLAALVGNLGTALIIRTLIISALIISVDVPF